MIHNRGRYYNYGPNLTKVTYDEISQDGAIKAAYTVQLARVDDYVRVFLKIRYDILKNTEFSRLAFCQMPSDYYNSMKYDKIAIGNVNGMTSEWQTKTNSWKYDKQSIPMPGNQPWVSLHAVKEKNNQGLFTEASRGLIVRQWKAVLGGNKVNTPHISTHMTGSHISNIRVASELSPPPGLKTLQQGDFMETDIELVILPSQAELYYGPNKLFQQALAKDVNTWRLVHREAKGNDLNIKIKEGALVNSYPIEIKVSEKQEALFTVTGGIGYVPLTFMGLNSRKGFKLYEVINGKPKVIDQSVNGNDFWQTDYDVVNNSWSMTYNILMESQNGKPSSKTLHFSSKPTP